VKPLSDYPIYHAGGFTGHRHVCRRCYRTQCLLSNARHRSKQKGLAFDLELEDIVIPTHCPLLGHPLAFTEGESVWSPSLDRIEPAKGYTKGNVQVISWRANQIKRDASLEELQRIGEWATHFKTK